MTSQPRLLRVRELFDGQRRFRVPIYQRAYAWGKVEIETLVRDLVSVLDRSSYYIGSLVLHEVRDVESDQPLFDVIDGQQRLTTLFLTLTHPVLRPTLLGLADPFQISERLLSFEERKRSNLDLASLARPDTQMVALEMLHDDGIKVGAEVVANLLGNEKRLVRLLVDQGIRRNQDDSPGLAPRILEYLLDHVQIVLTELPPDTDLNHYFEVMNTRGEQLAKHEIVKAHLLGVIGDDTAGRALFSTVWEACSDFTRHIQARFEPPARTRIFGGKWSSFLPTDAEALAGILKTTHHGAPANRYDLDALLAATDYPTRASGAAAPDDGDAGRYGAIIDFPNFLLHVLRLHADSDEDVSLDDKKLVVQFERTITTAADALTFAYRLLRAKFVFDNFVIKPLDEAGGNDSNWMLHRLHCVRPDTKKPKLSPRRAFGDHTRQVLMLQAMYQVTHQRRVYKEFLYQFLNYLDGSWAARGEIDGVDFIKHLHRMAEDDLDALDIRHDGGLDTGTGVPHFALNLLDYKLWWLSEIEKSPPEGLPSLKASKFRFAYRTSIEHFLAVNLAERDDQRAVVNHFGNLCLMTRSENSLRSDHTPDWKVQKYGTTNQSLKFYYMAKGQESAKAWEPAQITEQGAAMRAILLRRLPK